MGVKYDEVHERMMTAGRFKSSSALARDLDITPQALSNYKMRGEMPADLVIRFAEEHGYSIDWLIRGSEVVHGKTPLVPGEPLITEPLSPDEMIVVGKTLKMLRANDGLSVALRALIESAGQKISIEVNPVFAPTPEQIDAIIDGINAAKDRGIHI